MKAILAEQLLVKIMGWTPEEITVERPLLQAMANLKYDEYHQFSPGIRFIESLAQWLGQFELIEEKRTMYSFFKEHLIFISSDQMAHLVELSYSTVVNPIIIEQVSSVLSKKKYHIKKIIDSQAYIDAKKQSLFIGLSDGSRIDQLRRYAHLSNEQVLTTYYIDNEKVNEMIKELHEEFPQKEYSTVFLFDDFTASGTSYTRYEGGKPKGKVLKFLNKIYPTKVDDSNEESDFSNLVDTNNLSIHLVFYIATQYALERIEENVNKWITENNIINLKFTVRAIQLLDIGKHYLRDNKELIDIIKSYKYFDDTIVDKHYSMGNIDHPYLGFDECGLPLVLFHNTPNNSLPIIWFSEDKKNKGLFPRITRHKE